MEDLSSETNDDIVKSEEAQGSSSAPEEALRRLRRAGSFSTANSVWYTSGADIKYFYYQSRYFWANCIKFLYASTAVLRNVQAEELLESDRYIDVISIYWRLTICRMTRYRSVKNKKRERGRNLKYSSYIPTSRWRFPPVYYKSADKSDDIYISERSLSFYSELIL
jgi:hypothetical protein